MPEIQNEDAAWGDLDWGSTSEMEPPAPIESPRLVTEPEVPIFVPPSPSLPFEPVVGGVKEAEAPVIASQPLTPAFSNPPEDSLPSYPPSDRSPEGEPPVKTRKMVFTPSSVATLTLRSETGEESSFTISRDTTIGRHASNDLVIQDLHVSGHHARLSRGNDGRFEITDLGSSGGTFVNGVEIKTQALSSGDEIIFSTVIAAFHYVAGHHADSDLFAGGTIVKPKKEISRQAASSIAGGPSAKMTVHLLKGQSFTVDLKGLLTVGRAADNDVIIADEHVSGHHAKLICSAGGLIEVVDLQSTCGTFVNEEEVQSRPLKHGDRLRFGLVECTFEFGNPPANKAERRSVPAVKKGHSPMQMIFPAPESGKAP